MSDFFGDWNALLVLLLAGFLPNEIWRMLGLILGSGIDEGSELLGWVRAMATAEPAPAAVTTWAHSSGSARVTVRSSIIG